MCVSLPTTAAAVRQHHGRTSWFQHLHRRPSGPAKTFTFPIRIRQLVIDINNYSTDGIYVANCPDKNANAVSELAMWLILVIDRRMTDFASEEDDPTAMSGLIEVDEQNLGIVTIR